ncbi:hypothetical protein [Ferrovibrio sp.]|uniref:hypothetical protein n=1 Tax=Ferrovibrio sp. TaxID=1917215 RepID=UPI0026105070|nr:hypothetical protein [Ferrovibrio sp.]
MRSTRFVPLALILLLGPLAACGPPLAWQRPNTSLADAELDSRECAALARDQTFRESMFGPPYGYYGHPYGGYPFGPYPWSYYGPRRGYADSFMWRGQRESDLQDFCLRARGYRLAPVPQYGAPQ